MWIIQTKFVLKFLPLTLSQTKEFEQLAFDYLNLSDDHSRVILQPVEDDPSSDYINANYIDVSVLPGCFPRTPTVSAPVWELDACYYL